MELRILVISNYRDTNSVRPEAELFIGLQQAGVQVTVMTFGDAPYVHRFRQAGIHVIDFHPVSKFDSAESRRIREELLIGNYDVLHLFNSRAIINGIRAARQLPVKVVLYRGYTGNVHWYDPTAYLKYLHPRVDAIVCPASATTEVLNAQFFAGRRKRALTIRKGHNLEWYAGVTPTNSEQFGIVEKGAFIVACIANFRPVKGVGYLVEAMRHLPKELPIHLMLIGRDMDSPSIMDAIMQNPNKQRIHLTGFRTDVLNLLAGADLSVVPSVKAEANSKAGIEAMSLGVPTIITAIPGNRELVEHGLSGLVAPTRDSQALAAAILQLYHDRELCQALGRASKARIQSHFNIEDSILKTKELYTDLSANRRLSGK